jgi:hypothetical protein
MEPRIRAQSKAAVQSRAVRPLLIAFGWLNVGLGMVGTVVPGMPTTVFMLIALWAFAKSSPRFHEWLYNHSRFGPTLQAWHRHRVIPQRAKCLAGMTMAVSFAYLAVFVAKSWVMPTVVGGIMAAVAIFILSRPGTPPAE